MKMLSFIFLIFFAGCDSGKNIVLTNKSTAFSSSSSQEVEVFISPQDSLSGVLILKADSAFIEQISFTILNSNKSTFTKIKTTENSEPSSIKLNKAILVYYPDYYIIHFNANASSDSLYSIEIGKDIKYMVKGKYMEYLTWPEYMLRFFVTTTEKNPLRLEPKMTGKIVSVLDYSGLSFVCDQISGDWVKVTCYKACEGCNDGKVVTGWIRWRENGKVILKQYYTC